MKAAILSCLIAGSAIANPVPGVPSMLPPAIVQTALEQDPEVLAAAAALNAARQDGKALEQSPYEWTARVSAQRRSADPGLRSNEWNAGLERTLRLPAKAGADRNIAGATVDEASARYQIARRAASRSLIELWLAWQTAQEQQALAAAHYKGAQDNVVAVDKRVRAGDASKLDASLARAELAEQQRLENEAKTVASVAAARLKARFPGMQERPGAVPTPERFALSANALRERMVTGSAILSEADAQLRKAKGQSERARADRIPDPTVGIFTGSEARGQERITGVMLSIPIPGPQRATRASASGFAAEMTRQELELKRREVEANVAVMLATAEGARASWEIAESGAAAMRANAVLTQRAYVLGEVDLQALLTAGRLATAAEQTALSAKAEAARAEVYCQ